MSEDNFKVHFIGIGAQKAATTWIYNCLIEHPEVCGPKQQGGAVTKELHYFHKDRPLPFEEEKTTGEIPIEEEGLESYKKYFSHCEQSKIKGEYTPAYLYYEETPQLIKKYFPDVKLIACLRNPIERAYSQYAHEVQHSEHNYSDGRDLGQITFSEAIEKEPEILERGLYYQQLKRYFNLFPKEKILVLIYENIQQDPLGFIQKVYEFLEVDSDFQPKQVDIKINQREGRMSYLSKLIHMKFRFLLKQSKIGKKVSFSPTMRKFLYSFLGKGKSSNSKKKIDSELRQELREYYKEDINKLEDLLDKDLSHWK